MTNPVYILLCGLPAAGKSTICTKLYNLWREPKPIILSTDDYIEAVAAGRGSTYTEEFRANIKSAESYVATIRTASLRAGSDILHDQTNLTISSRAKKLAGIPRTYTKVCLVVGASESARQVRLLNRPGKTIPSDVDAQMRASWQNPALAEGFDEIIHDWAWQDVLLPYFARTLQSAG